MTAFLIRRAAFGVVTLFAVLTLVFVIVRILPGDPAQLILGDQASREAIEALRARLGLDQPIPLQYLSFLANALRGDWGVSMVTGQPVLAEVLNVLPWTIDLTLVSLALGVALGVPLGVWAAVQAQPLRRLCRANRFACRAFLSRLCLRHHPLVPFRHRIALVSGDLRAQRLSRKPGRSRSRCRRSALASTARPTSPG